MNNRQREEASDRKTDPVLWYVYILQKCDGSFYIGQTNDLQTRVLEHGLDAGAEATKGQQEKLKWWNHCHDRDAAIALEQRLQAALDRSPLEIEGVIERFDTLHRMIRPEKSLAELRAEERAYAREMRRAFHHRPIVIGQRGATCGWIGVLDGDAPLGSEPPSELYGTSDWERLFQMERERKALESVGGKPKDGRLANDASN